MSMDLTRRAMLLGTSAIPIGASKVFAKSPAPPKRCDDDIMEVALQAADHGPKLVLQLPHRAVGLVTDQGSLRYNDLSLPADCRTEVSGTEAIILAQRAAPLPLCNEIRLYARTEESLVSYYSNIVQKSYREAYQSGAYEKIGDWYCIQNRKAAFFDPKKLRFAHDLWLTYDGRVLGAFYRDHFYLTNWTIPFNWILSPELSEERLGLLLKVYESSVEFLNKHATVIDG